MTARVGIIGAGIMGTDHAYTLRDSVPGATVEAVSDADASRAALIGVRVVNDPLALIKDPNIDAVLIASSDATHEQFVLACLAAGKPALCEKPLAADVAGCQRIVAAETEVGRRLISVGFMRRYDPGYVALKHTLDAGDLGAPLIMHCVHRNVSAPAWFASDMVITNSAGHEIDITRWLFGDEIAAVTVHRPRRSAALADPVLLVFETVSGVVVVDETGFLKKGTKSAGVARQYSGTAGRRENQQIGVFLLYASDRGAAFLDRALYLPDEWVGDAARRAEAHIPADVAFATKGELARELLARAFGAGVPARWVVGDTVYSADELRRWLEGQGRSYVLAVPETHGLWTRGHQQTVEQLIAALPADAWTRLSAGEGSQGPRWYDWACLALPYAAASGKAHWLLARRSVSDPTKLAYYRVYGPAETPVTEMVRVAGRRWTIEEGFEQAKGEVGLDQYEVRRYDAWYRYITLALLAHALLEVTRLRARQGHLQDGKGGERSATATALR